MMVVPPVAPGVTYARGVMGRDKTAVCQVVEGFNSPRAYRKREQNALRAALHSLAIAPRAMGRMVVKRLGDVNFSGWLGKAEKNRVQGEGR
jgi:hypothetical protein